MSRIPHDVERLMWLVAENRDPKAISDFETRFPDLKIELSKRISMVNDLKHAGRITSSHDIPRFVPKYAPPRPVFGRMAFAVAAVVLAAVAFGTYAITSMGTPPPKLPDVPIVKTDPPVDLNPKVEFKNQPLPKQAENDGPKVEPWMETPVTPHGPSPADKPLTIKGTLPLVAVIQEVCKQVGITAEIAPGLSQQEIEVDFHEVPAHEILATLGQKYGFSVRPQQPGTILIVPVLPDSATDTGSSTLPPNTGDPKAPLPRTTDPDNR